MITKKQSIADLSVQIPSELLPFTDERIWAVFELGEGHKKRPMTVTIPGGKNKIQSCTDPSTLFTYKQAIEELNDNRCLALSIPLASDLLGKVLTIADLDCYKEGFSPKVKTMALSEETFIDVSPSGKGLHVWRTYNVVTPLPKRKGVDDVKSFITLSGNVIKPLPIMHVELSDEEVKALAQYDGNKESQLEPVNDGQLSVIYAFNLQNDIEDMLMGYGFELKGGGRWQSPESQTDSPGGKIFPSNNQPWSLFFTHNETGIEGISKRAVDAFELYAYFQHRGDKSAAAKALLNSLNAIDIETGEILDQTIGEYNKEQEYRYIRAKLGADIAAEVFSNTTAAITAIAKQAVENRWNDIQCEEVLKYLHTTEKYGSIDKRTLKREFKNVLRSLRQQSQQAVQKYSPANPASLRQTVRFDISWPDVVVSDNGERLRASIDNFKAMLNAYGIRIQYDEMLKEIDFSFPIDLNVHEDTKEEAYTRQIETLCNRNDLPVSCVNDIVAVAGEHTYNPVLSWIQSKPWDGVDRLQTLFATVQSPHPQKNEILKVFFLQCVAALDNAKSSPLIETGEAIRAFEYILVFISEQGFQKTKYLLSLLPREFHEYLTLGLILDLRQKDSVKEAVSSWLVELGELDGTFDISAITELKAFTSRTTDTIRLPYARKATKFKRRTCFIGTVNHETYLRDFSGNRRYLSIPIEGLNRMHGIDLQQLWAQLFHLYCQGERWWPDAQLERQIAAYNNLHTDYGDLCDEIPNHFTIRAEHEDQYQEYSCTQIVNIVQGTPLNQSVRKTELNRVSAYLKASGAERMANTKKYKLVPISSRAIEQSL